MINFEELTKDQLKIIRAYSFGGIGWFSAVSRLVVLGLKQKDAEYIINETGIVGWMG